jgi:hypothetical protein
MADVKLFIDFWNFQLGWNDNMMPGRRQSAQPQPLVKISWKDVPGVLIGELPAILGAGSAYAYKGARIYASVNPAPGGRDEGLKKFLNNVLGQMTGFQGAVGPRLARPTVILNQPFAAVDAFAWVMTGIGIVAVVGLLLLAARALWSGR